MTVGTTSVTIVGDHFARLTVARQDRVPVTIGIAAAIVVVVVVVVVSSAVFTRRALVVVTGAIVLSGSVSGATRELDRARIGQTVAQASVGRAR